MKTLLVIAEHPGLADAVKAGLSAEQYRILHRTGVDEAEPLLDHGFVDVCLFDVELTSVQGVWFVERLHRRAPKVPIIIFTSATHWEWEEEAYLKGAAHVLTKPVRPRMLAAVLDRLWPATPLLRAAAPPAQLPAASVPEVAPTHDTGFLTPTGPMRTLSVLRDFSGILTHSLNAEGMLRQFLLLLREILSVNRAVIFLHQPYAAVGSGGGAEPRRLRAVSAIGLPAALLQHFELSFESGIGGHVFRLGRILRRNSEEIRQDIESQKEFELLGTQVAVPILDRETAIGVAVFDGRITGEPLVNSELELVFHLLEQLGMAIKNIWLHDQLAGNHEMMADILRELSSACIVVNRELAILHANKTARRIFAGKLERRSGELEFSDLPQVLGSKIYQVLKTGSAIANFRYEPEEAAGTIYNISVVPFQRQPGGLPNSALLMAEDLTQSEQLQKLQIEAANLRLVKSMAYRLANEVGNALVPLTAHQQLLPEKWKDPEFRTSLEGAMADSVKRVSRLLSQMRFLARDGLLSEESFPLGPLIEEAYQEACKYEPAKPSQLKCEPSGKGLVATGDRSALKHALAEVMLNALQANPSDPKVGVRLSPDSKGGDRHELEIEVQDNGAGFPPEVLDKVTEPFFTMRNVGVGLGLTVSRKIIETHRGKLEIRPGKPGIVRISLPLDRPAALKPAA
jgi:signal transduction histidine kinase/CheY-like chemotaxis protein